jgi:hypothetical protein
VVRTNGRASFPAKWREESIFVTKTFQDFLEAMDHLAQDRSRDGHVMTTNVDLEVVTLVSKAAIKDVTADVTVGMALPDEVIDLFEEVEVDLREIVAVVVNTGVWTITSAMAMAEREVECSIDSIRSSVWYVTIQAWRNGRRQHPNWLMKVHQMEHGDIMVYYAMHGYTLLLSAIVSVINKACQYATVAAFVIAKANLQNDIFKMTCPKKGWT